MSNSLAYSHFPPFCNAHPLSPSCSQEITDNNLLKRLFLSIWRDVAVCPHTRTMRLFLTFKACQNQIANDIFCCSLVQRFKEQMQTWLDFYIFSGANSTPRSLNVLFGCQDITMWLLSVFSMLQCNCLLYIQHKHSRCVRNRTLSDQLLHLNLNLLHDH